MMAVSNTVRARACIVHQGTPTIGRSDSVRRIVCCAVFWRRLRDDGQWDAEETLRMIGSHRVKPRKWSDDVHRLLSLPDEVRSKRNFYR